MRVTGKGLPIPNLVRYLSDQSGRQVIDETGLTGKYDFQFAFAPDLGEIAGPSLFTALQEQLGLKLESKKGPVEVVVIESVEKPSEN
ncbi:MAG TPA: TIGR03435 family protein, partial [Bryobacteraceae bacterium]|nr:TIGR03435 family protein [Bryobacteraceae bacterium]